MKDQAWVGIDPGLDGYLVLCCGPLTVWEPMPTTPRPDRNVNYPVLKECLTALFSPRRELHAVMERVHPWAMSAKSAFGFGRAYAAVEIALQELRIPYTLVEPSKWMAYYHQGIRKELKPKAKSEIALKRRFPHIHDVVPKKGKRPHDGAVDAYLIAQWGKSQQSLLMADF